MVRRRTRELAAFPARAAHECGGAAQDDDRGVHRPARDRDRRRSADRGDCRRGHSEIGQAHRGIGERTAAGIFIRCHACRAGALCAHAAQRAGGFPLSDRTRRQPHRDRERARASSPGDRIHRLRAAVARLHEACAGAAAAWKSQAPRGIEAQRAPHRDLAIARRDAATHGSGTDEGDPRRAARRERRGRMERHRGDSREGCRRRDFSTHGQRGRGVARDGRAPHRDRARHRADDPHRAARTPRGIAHAEGHAAARLRGEGRLRRRARAATLRGELDRRRTAQDRGTRSRRRKAEGARAALRVENRAPHAAARGERHD